MKTLTLIISTLFYIGIHAQQGMYIYPVKYQNFQNILIKIPKAPTDLRIEIEGESGILELVDNTILLENRALDKPVILNFKSSHRDSIIFSYDASENTQEMLKLDLPLYQALTLWSTNKEQKQKLSDYLLEVSQQKNIYPEEVLYFLQRYFKGFPIYSTSSTLKENISNAFNTYKASQGMANGCACIQLNHDAEIAPLKPNAGFYGDGYNYLDQIGQFSQGINKITYFDSNIPKWHRWYTNEKGPAHDMFLRQYDQGGSFNYEWSSVGTTGNIISPNNASLLFNFFCSELGQELPDECNCTKDLTILYRYDANFRVIANKLKPLSKVHSIAQEISTITYSNTTGGVELIDAGMAKYETKCNGNFNFDFIKNWFELGEAILGVVIDVQDTVQGTIPQDILSNLGDIVNALENIATTSPIEVTGDCAPKHGSENLMAGSKVLQLKANDPVVVNMSSFTFLGTYGKRKWDNYANIGSNFWLQGFVESGSEEGLDHCCSDKVTRFVQASVKGPKSESDLVNWIESWVKIYAPWENFVQVGDFPIINRKANRGYFTYDDPDRDCFPASPKLLRSENEESLNTLEIKSSENTLVDDEEPIENASKLDPELAFKLYPNPGNDFINIDIANCEGSHLDISIYNSLGQQLIQILNETIHRDNISIQWLDEYNQLETGTYFVVVKQNKKLVSSKALRIVK